jgi:ADP-heptose:LPS heptosyltransferase
MPTLSPDFPRQGEIGLTTQTLVPAKLLQNADKILFVAHLALGDFTYMENCFKAFHAAYPHIRIHLLIDEVRRTYDFRQWKFLKDYVLFDWVRANPIFEKIYDRTYSPFVLRQSIKEARRQNYPIVVSFGLSRRTFYARLVHGINPSAFKVAITKPYRSTDLFKRWIFGRLDVNLTAYPSQPRHISAIYAGWFEQLFGICMSPAQRFPSLQIPEKWKIDATNRLREWGIDIAHPSKRPMVFVNAFSKQDERSWPFEQALDLVRRMKELARWRDADFVVNTVPEEWDKTQAVLEQSALSRTFLFNAERNFFQLPAMLSLCDLIISVETAVMHLANAVHVPVIAMMRQVSPEWAPIDKENSRIVTTSRPEEWVKDIQIDRVIEALPRGEKADSPVL